MVLRTKLCILVNDSPSLINANSFRSSNGKRPHRGREWGHTCTLMVLVWDHADLGVSNCENHNSWAQVVCL